MTIFMQSHASIKLRHFDKMMEKRKGGVEVSVGVLVTGWGDRYGVFI